MLRVRQQQQALPAATEASAQHVGFNCASTARHQRQFDRNRNMTGPLPHLLLLAGRYVLSEHAVHWSKPGTWGTLLLGTVPAVQFWQAAMPRRGALVMPPHGEHACGFSGPRTPPDHAATSPRSHVSI
jgi:hypothetical protein